MRLGVRLALTMTALVAAVVVSAIVSIDVYQRRAKREELVQKLDDKVPSLQEVQRTDLRVLGQIARGYADEPRIRALINSAQVDDLTITDEAREIRVAAKVDMMLLTGAAGTVRANVTARGKAIAIPPGYIENAEAPDARKEFAAAWVLEGELYLVAGRAITLGERTSGMIIAGAILSNEQAERIHRMLDTDVVLVANERITAAAVDPHLSSHRVELAEALRAVANQAKTKATEVSVAGQTYVVRLATVEGLEGPRASKAAGQTHFAMLRSLDKELESYYKSRSFLLKLGFFAIAVAILAALVIANTLSRRVSRLASATTLVAAGDLDTSVPIGGRDEIGALGRAFNDMIAKLRISREELRSKERLERELEIATVIQTLLLPAQPALDGYDVAARMVPAEEVGGDFYDVHTASAGSWIAIGDVSGHGVTPGLIMMMVQSMLSAIARQSPEVGEKYSPREVLRVINSALHDNLRTRMHDDNYMTMVLLKHVGGGKFRYAGAHESILVYRRSSHQVDTLPTDGTWLGLQDDIGPFIEEHEVELSHGDALVLYTDGVTEAKNPQGVQYNLDRLRDMLIKQGSMSMPSAQKIRDGIIDDVMSWSRTRQDDVTVMVLRRMET